MKFIELEGEKVLVIESKEKPENCSWKDLLKFIKQYKLAEKEYSKKDLPFKPISYTYTEYDFTRPIRIRIYGDCVVKEIIK